MSSEISLGKDYGNPGRSDRFVREVELFSAKSSDPQERFALLEQQSFDCCPMMKEQIFTFPSSKSIPTDKNERHFL